MALCLSTRVFITSSSVSACESHKKGYVREKEVLIPDSHKKLSYISQIQPRVSTIAPKATSFLAPQVMLWALGTQ